MDLFEQIKDRILQQAQIDYNNQVRTLQQNKLSSISDTRSEYGTNVYELDYKTKQLEQQKQGQLLSAELLNLQKRNELKNLIATSGGNVVGAEAIQSLNEEIALSNVTEAEKVAQIDVGVQGVNLQKGLSNTITTINNQYKTQQQQLQSVLNRTQESAINTFELEKMKNDSYLKQVEMNKQMQDIQKEEIKKQTIPLFGLMKDTVVKPQQTQTTNNSYTDINGLLKVKLKTLGII